MIESLNRKHLADIIVRKLQLKRGDSIQFFRDKVTNGILIVKIANVGSDNNPDRQAD
jgi:DNA-directed RNA polymerase subunit H (RpoH/RPB5)